jgi:predicted nucleotidyltransferase
MKPRKRNPRYGRWSSVLAPRYRDTVIREVDPVCQRLEIADGLASVLRAADSDGAAILFGSSARGDATEDSDLDLLVISTHRDAIDAARTISRQVRLVKVSLLTHTWSSFGRLRDEDWLFVRHLSKEAVVLWDPHREFTRRCEVPYPGAQAVTDEIRRHGRAMAHLSDIERYGTDFLFPLANTYALAKRIAMLANARRDVHIFDRDRAIAACAELYPGVARDLQTLRGLAPFYALTRGVRSIPTPFPSEHAGPALLEHTRALARVIHAVCA